MHPILVFLMEHWILSGAFVLVALLFVLNEWRYRAWGIKGLSPQELVSIMNHSQGVVVDVRSPERFQQGHILGALNVPQTDFEKGIKSLDKLKKKPIILVCMSGLEAPKLRKTLAEKGFTQLYYLSGGLGAWQSNGLPVTQ